MKLLNFNCLISSYILTGHLSLQTSPFPRFFLPFTLLFFAACQLLSSCPSPLCPLSFSSFCPQHSLFLSCRNPVGIDVHGHKDLGRPFYRWNMSPSTSLKNFFQVTLVTNLYVSCATRCSTDPTGWCFIIGHCCGPWCCLERVNYAVRY